MNCFVLFVKIKVDHRSMVYLCFFLKLHKKDYRTNNVLLISEANELNNGKGCFLDVY